MHQSAVQTALRHSYRLFLSAPVVALFTMGVGGYCSSRSDTLSLNSDTNAVRLNEYPQERAITLEDIEGNASAGSSDSGRREPRHLHSKKGSTRSVQIHIMADMTAEYFMGNRDTTYSDGSISQIEDSSRISFSSDHHHVFISAHMPSNVFASFEMVSRAFWEVGYKSGRFSATFGKLPIPWGHMRYHHIFGGLVEKPEYNASGESMLVPGEWAEYGIGVAGTLIDTYPFLLQTEVTITNGLRVYSYAGIPDTTVDFGKAVSLAPDNNRDKAIGIRVRSHYKSVYSLNGSFYTSKIAEDDFLHDATLFHGDRVYAGEIDAAASYNSMPWGPAANLESRAGIGLLRAVRTNSTAEVPLHYQIAGFFEANYRIIPDILRLQGRFGLYDDNVAVVTSGDLYNYTLACYVSPVKNIKLIARYIWSRERVKERHNDCFKIRFFARI